MKSQTMFSLIFVLLMLTSSCEELYINEDNSNNSNNSNTTSTSYTGNFTGSCYFTSHIDPDNSGEVGTDLSISTSSSGYRLHLDNNPGCAFACAGIDITTYCNSNGKISHVNGSYEHVGSITLGSNSGSFAVYYGGVIQWEYSFSCSTEKN